VSLWWVLRALLRKLRRRIRQLSRSVKRMIQRACWVFLLRGMRARELTSVRYEASRLPRAGLARSGQNPRWMGSQGLPRKRAHQNWMKKQRRTGATVLERRKQVGRRTTREGRALIWVRRRLGTCRMARRTLALLTFLPHSTLSPPH
jgi:hypothetical protein